jgi:hypothetical protein
MNKFTNLMKSFFSNLYKGVLMLANLLKKGLKFVFITVIYAVVFIPNFFIGFYKGVKGEK